MIKKILSYFTPIKIHTVNSAISKSIEVIWSKGELVMDSENANYSYGNLQRILKLGLKTIGFDKIATMHHVLVLGVAGGSVIKTLVNEIKFQGKITGVEIDPEIIKIANQYFKLDEIEQLEIIIDDAFEFVLKTKDKYDLIIIDVFQDLTMPNFLFETFFTDRICFLLNSKGVILFNTMLLNENHNKRNSEYFKSFNDADYVVKSIPRVERHNELIVIEKKH
ncbi:spermidine synthase [Flavobacterium sp. W22_SRS_FP1]|uniref:spermidine synthase n=1 Tax=Flavobacterium sp. W22_SRS_FP1 TaxID=3240276 RepID=UPI003F8EC72B